MEDYRLKVDTLVDRIIKFGKTVELDPLQHLALSKEFGNLGIDNSDAERAFLRICAIRDSGFAMINPRRYIESGTYGLAVTGFARYKGFESPMDLIDEFYSQN